MSRDDLQIVLYQPEIPQNTGAVIRLCAGTGASLHLIRPLGFQIADKQLRRVALGYHTVLEPVIHGSLEHFFSRFPESQIYFFSSKASRYFYEGDYSRPSALVFGSETSGLPDPEPWRQNGRQITAVKIPQAENFRCHNLASSVAVGLYEVMRQRNYGQLG